jgi:phage protein|nr:MAG TPA: hypothetical protein [Caudoviricetes sp.]
MDLISKLKSEFNNKYANNSKIRRLVDQLEKGDVEYEQAHQFAIEIGELLANIFKENLSEDMFPDKKMNYDVADKILNETLGKNYELVSDYSRDIQTIINKKAGFNLKGLKADKNQSRIDNMAKKISENEIENVQWMFDEPVKNFTQSIVDDTVKTNADFQYKLGMQPKIIRKSTGDCCEWCEELVGEYDYPYGVPPNVYKRHRFCRCTIEHRPAGAKKGTNIHTKRILNSREDIDERLRRYRQELNDENFEKERRKLERILKAEKKNNVDNSVNSGYIKEETISDIRKKCISLGIEYNEIKKSSHQRTENEIINYLGGGDKTKGSCSSLSLAYIGNKKGYDVLDFRDGESRTFFATKKNIEKIANLDGVIGYIEKDKNDFVAVKKLIGNMKIDKEYYLATGEHAAIIRKNSKGFEYLELQTEDNNGFKKLTDSELKTRFICKKSHTVLGMKYEATSILIDVDSLIESDEFNKILGFLNTEQGNQKKGVGGYAK